MNLIFVALLCVAAFPILAGATELKIFQGYIVGSAFQDEEESPIIQGHVVGGVTAEDGENESETPSEALSFTVSFEPGDGAKLKAKSKTVTNGRAYGELPVPERKGYVFDGWRNESGAKVTANTIVNLDADQTLYAQWSVPTYEVRLDANGGSVKPAAVAVPAGGDYGELPRPTRTGFVFDGWHTRADGGVPVADRAPLLLNADHTLYAHWTLAAPILPNEETLADAAAFRFLDVSPASSYYDAVRWAVEQGITSGTSAETFSPNAPCKLRHVLTFLWRANGSPSTKRVLDSVTPGTLWAYENALVPFDVLYHDEVASTRSDAVTCLWKLAGSPTDKASLRSITGRFSDVPPESECAAAVAWALDNGITNGTTETTFSPDKTCTRGQIVTFLYRCYAE